MHIFLNALIGEGACANKTMNNCHVCMSGIKPLKGGALPPACPACGADLENPGSEVMCKSIECEHLKGALGIGNGELFITNKRVFWIARKDDETANALVGAMTGKNANKVTVNFPIGDLDRIEDCKKLLRKGITVHTKNGESFNFFLVNRGNPQILKDMFAPYIGK